MFYCFLTCIERLHRRREDCEAWTLPPMSLAMTISDLGKDSIHEARLERALDFIYTIC